MLKFISIASDLPIPFTQLANLNLPAKLKFGVLRFMCSLFFYLDDQAIAGYKIWNRTRHGLLRMNNIWG